MNDERFLKDWLQDTTDPNSQPQASADKVMARLPEARQRSRWWPWLPRLRRVPEDSTPDITGRTRSMISPIQAITAGALTFALGGIFLFVQAPEQAQDMVSGAAGDVEPVIFSGSIEGGPPVQGGFSPTMTEVSDPRLDGTVFWSRSATDADLGEYGWQTLRIETEDGAWQGSFPAFSVEEGQRSVSVFTGHLMGEGDYEGLVAITELDSSLGQSGSLWGLIVDADTIPEPPEPARPLATE